MDLFTHPYESTKANTAILNQQRERLSLNAWIILFCLLEGQQLHSYDFSKGIKLMFEMDKPRYMLEYRRRLCELKSAGIEILSLNSPNGTKTHWIDRDKIGEYRTKYEPYKLELLAKLNK